jgi:hypothetical protein
MPNILLVTNKIEYVQTGGRELLSKFNHDVLKDLYGSKLYVTELVKIPIRDIKSKINSFRGHIDGVNLNSIELLFDSIFLNQIEMIFIDGSNLGNLVKLIKKKIPSIKICTYFHNVEAKFFLGALLENPSIHAFAVLIVNFLAERKAVKYSDIIVCLSNRDSRLLSATYGRLATHISPMALQDDGIDFSFIDGQPPKEKFALFVGSGFYANRAGITWFCEHVAPYVPIKTCIVGRGLEDLKILLEYHSNVQVIGTVDNLKEWYREAHFVIAPIFDGSGMKTKVAEALLFGKKIVGTPEAFSGYEEIAEQAGWICKSAREFQIAMIEANSMTYSSFNTSLRRLFDINYSFAAARDRMHVIIEGTIQSK